MQARTAWTLAACLFGSAMVGCSASPGIIRAQSPSEGTAGQTAVINAAAYSDGSPAQYQQVGLSSFQNISHGYEQSCSPGGGCPPGGYCGPNGDCNDDCHEGCLGCECCRKDWYPTHYHKFTYAIPWNGWAISPSQLSYPPQNQPAAVVQYPYYTVRGPTDFFLK